MKRKIISLLLALVLLVSLMPAALAAEGSFTDITDEETAQAAEILRLLGVVDGVGGSKFNPAGNLKRAEFCKMAVVMMGIEDQEPGYRNRTIFTDVDSKHWARGYINLAASGQEKFISGMGNGKFAPEENITFAQAVTILVRLLGYSDSDTNMQWPEGYLTLADTVGLTDGFDTAANAAITRAQAARLFAEMLLCSTKNGGAYLGRFGNVSEGVIILSNDAVAADGSSGAVYTTAGTYKTDVPVADSTVGKRGTLAAADGKLVVFIPTDAGSRTISVSQVESGWFKTSDGSRYTVASDTVVYTESGASVWNEVWLDMPAGSNITVYFDANLTSSSSTLIYDCGTYDDPKMQVILGPNVTSVPNDFLQNCAIKEFIYPEGVETIRTNSLVGCNALERVVFPSTLKSISHYTINNCPAIKTIVYNAKNALMSSDGYFAVNNSGHPEGLDLLFAEDVETLPVRFMAGCTVQEVVFPDSLKAIPDEAIRNCNMLTTVNIPENVAAIGNSAFSGNESLKEIDGFADALCVFADFTLKNPTEYEYGVKAMLALYEVTESGAQKLVKLSPALDKTLPAAENGVAGTEDFQASMELVNLDFTLTDKHVMKLLVWEDLFAFYPIVEPVPLPYGAQALPSTEGMYVIEHAAAADLNPATVMADNFSVTGADSMNVPIEDAMYIPQTNTIRLTSQTIIETACLMTSNGVLTVSGSDALINSTVYPYLVKTAPADAVTVISTRFFVNDTPVYNLANNSELRVLIQVANTSNVDHVNLPYTIRVNGDPEKEIDGGTVTIGRDSTISFWHELTDLTLTEGDTLEITI